MQHEKYKNAAGKKELQFTIFLDQTKFIFLFLLYDICIYSKLEIGYNIY